MKRIALVLGSAALAGCAWLSFPDQLREEARSPDGALVARAWCTDGCDVPHKRAITISPAGEAVGDRLPGDETASTAWFAEQDGARFNLRWAGPRHLVAEGDCLSDGNFRPLRDQTAGEVRINFVSLPSSMPCERRS